MLLDAKNLKMTNYERLMLMDISITEEGINQEALKSIVESYDYRSQELYDKYRRYIGEKIPIQTRTFTNEDKINHKINNDFFAEIIDTKVGYMVGKPVIYKSDVLKDELLYFEKYNNLEDLDATTLTLSAICGTSYRLMYIDENGNLSVMSIPPWECIYIEGIDGNVKYAIRVIEVNINYKIVTVYTKDNVYEYDVKDDAYILSKVEDNIFGEIPVVEFKNNDEELGDCDKVIELIDGYDRALSDVNSEIEQFRLAYLLLEGFEMESSEIEEMKKTGALCVPDGGKAYFVTKNLDDNIIEHHLDRVEKNILRFSKSVNFSDDAFGTASGVALKYKLQALDNKALKGERKFGVGLRRQFELASIYWSVRNDISDTDITWTFRRNIPLDVLDEAETTNKLKGYVSEKTRLSRLTFIDDVEKEVEEMEQEQIKSIDSIQTIAVDENDEEL